jgi:hypothetical protein
MCKRTMLKRILFTHILKAYIKAEEYVKMY